MDRKCGYCREYGHRSPVCPLRADHRKSIVTHNIETRKSLYNILLANGIGNGAIIKDKGDDTLFMITPYADIVSGWSFTDIKYSKQVAIRYSVLERGNYIPITLSVMRLSNTGPRPDIIHTSLSALVPSYAAMYAWDRNRFTLVEESREAEDISYTEWGSNIYIPVRLRLGKEKGNYNACFDPHQYA